jgi:prepilin-type processing-associated H-X9-DG protein
MSYADYVLRWDVKGENHSSSIAYRHFGGTKVNIGHFDGSVECLSRPEAWHDDPAVDEQLWVIYGQK